MSDDRSTFETTRARLEDIVVQVRRKDVSLEQSLDMLEEAVRLVNQCNELIDQTSFRAAPAAEGEPGQDADAAPAAVAAEAGEPGLVPAEGDSAHTTDEVPDEVPDEVAESDEDAGSALDEGGDASVDAVAILETFELLELDGADIATIEFFEDDDVAGARPEIEDDERS